jgi:CBS domain-containing protein
VGAFDVDSAAGQTAADLMLAKPKTLPSDVTVAAARELLADEHVQMLLLTEGAAFRGTITHIPDEADPDTEAIRYCENSTETIAPEAPAAVAFTRTQQNPYRRVVVLDEQGTLLGLLCLDKSRTRFCTGGC